MKKGLLTLSAGLLASVGAFAAGGNLVSGAANTYWDAELYAEWDTVAVQHLASFYTIENGFTVDSAIGVTGIADALSDANKTAWTTQWEGNNRYAINIANNEMTITFDPANPLGSDNKKIDNVWGNIQFEPGGYRNAEGKTATPDKDDVKSVKINDTTFISISNDSLSKYFFVGKSIDMTENKTIAGKILIPGNFVDPNANDVKKRYFTIRVSVVDVHGHEWNAGGDPCDTIKPEEWGDYADFLVDYDAIEIDPGYGKGDMNPGDGWGSAFINMPRPISKDKVRVPIDFANIAGVRIYLEPGEDHDGSTAVTIKIKDLVIGDPATVSVNEEKTTSEVAYTQEGRTFNAEGAVKLVNLGNGIEVAAVNGSVTAPAAGAYALVTETGSVKVAVK